MVSSGFTSTNFLENLSQYVVSIIVALVVLLIPLVLMAVPKLRASMKGKLYGILGKYFFNGYIVAQNISYLKCLLVVGLSLI